MIVDADLWAQKATLAQVAPYLPDGRRRWLRLDVAGGAQRFPESRYFVAGAELDEAAAAPDPQSLAAARLDRDGVALAVLNPGVASSVSGYASPVVGAEMARAVNELTAAEWLGADERLRGSIVVSPRSPRRAADEVRRAGADARFAQVLLAYPPWLLGSGELDPLFEAACELDLPLNLTAGGDHSGANAGVAPVGEPSSSFDALVSWEFGAQPHLLSLIADGAFDRFTSLRVVLSGFGVAWLPSLLWRMDRELDRGVARTRSPLARRPSEYVLEHVRLTTSPLELPGEPERLVRLLELIDGDRLLAHASGALGGEDARALLARLEPAARDRVASGNAVAYLRSMVAVR